MRVVRQVLMAMAMAVAAPPALAEPAVFDLSIRGLRAGTLVVEGVIREGRYRVEGRLDSAGLVDLVRRMRYSGLAEGAVRGKRYTPVLYRESADTGRRQSDAVMEYRRGVPQVKVYDPPRAPDEAALDPATQGGTVDPLTALFAALRDVHPDEACDLGLTLFDGKRRSQVRLGPPEPAAAGEVTCEGEYRRLDGFSAEDMAEKARFPFTLRLAPAPDGRLRVAEVTMDTLYGNARLKRR
jgi:hypothetical protein